MKKHLWAAALALSASAGIFIGCESLNGPESAVDESLNSEESFAVSTLDGETGILKSSGVDVESANAFFVLRWSEVPRRLRSDATVKGHASAVAFEEPTTLRDRSASGLDMGSVSVLIDQDKFDLAKLVHDALGVRYGQFGGPHGGPKGPRGGHGGPNGGFGGPHGGRNGERPAMINIPFVAGGTYQFDITGSDKVAAMTLDIQAPAQLVNITGLTDKQTIDITQDLTVTWEGDAAATNMVLVLAPARKPGRFGGSGQPVEPVFQSLDAAAGNYTISAQTLQDLVNKSEAKALSLHLAQGVHREITDVNLGKILISAGTDDRVTLTVQ